MQNNSKLIFMVDDDKIILNLLEYVFQGKNGYKIKTFFTGEECIENMHLNPDLVVLDYILNDKNNEAMDGLETLKRLIEIRKDLPVIILSSHADEKIRNLFLENGARAVLGKDDFFVDNLEKFISSELV